MSDRGIPTAPMYMNGYGSHTFSFWNHDGERFWVKFHFKTVQGHRHFTNREAAEVIGRSRETYQEALYNSINQDAFPQWSMHVQVMAERDAEKKHPTTRLTSRRSGHTPTSPSLRSASWN